jgi:hypothetical protein
MARIRRERLPVLGVPVYTDRLYCWFEEGGAQGPGLLTSHELQEKAHRDLKAHFQAGDWEIIESPIGMTYKWMNQLAHAIVQFRRRGHLVKTGKYYYLLDIVTTWDASRVRRMRKVRRTRKPYTYHDVIQPKKKRGR